MQLGKTRDLFKKIRYQGNISCKYGLNKGQKWYGPNRSRRYSEEVAGTHRRTIHSLVFLTSYVLTFSASFLSCLLLTQPCLFVGLPFQPHFFFIYTWASLVAQTLKHLLTMRETQVRSLGWEDPLEKKMAAHSSILAWKIPWTQSLVGYSPWGHKESDMTEQLHFTSHIERWRKERNATQAVVHRRIRMSCFILYTSPPSHPAHSC